MKPILIDALHINMGGALMILNHLVNKLVEGKTDFVLLKDNRCPLLQSEKHIDRIEIMPADYKSRNRYYRHHRNEFHSVLCLGNIPPYIKMPCPVYTYIHNVSLLEIPTTYPLRWRIQCNLKRRFIGYFSKNTDGWIVQTSHTCNLVKKYLPNKNKEIHIFPFYHIPDDMSRIPHAERTDYVFIGEHTNAKGHDHLIKAWQRLGELGFNGRLHLTVGSPTFKPVVDKAIKSGAKIINHGHIEFDKVITLYNSSKALIYPSLNESLGLGVVEAISAECDVIGCDLPYLHSICNPSEVFNPSDPDSIISAVMRYENCKTRKRTVLTISDKADELIDYLKNVK